MSASGYISFPNPGTAGGLSTIQTGSSDIGDQTSFNGISLICSAAVELNWANGILTSWSESIIPLHIASPLQVTNSVSLDSATITSDGSGNLTAVSLHANNGFTGSGVFTTFTIVDGIITAAS